MRFVRSSIIKQCSKSPNLKVTATHTVKPETECLCLEGSPVTCTPFADISRLVPIGLNSRALLRPRLLCFCQEDGVTPMRLVENGLYSNIVDSDHQTAWLLFLS